MQTTCLRCRTVRPPRGRHEAELARASHRQLFVRADQNLASIARIRPVAIGMDKD